VIVDAAWYVGGRRTVEAQSIEELAAERGAAGFGWLGLRMPSDRELDVVRDASGLPELAIRRRPPQARPPEGRAPR